MSLRIQQLTLPVHSDLSEGHLRRLLAQQLRLPVDDITTLIIRKKSLDARQKRKICYHYQIDFTTHDDAALLKARPELVSEAPPAKSSNPLEGLALPNATLRQKPIIIGSGPAGIFAALVLAEAGQPSIIIERGEPVETRMRTVNALRRNGSFNNESNYCFGEGGAGTFSDGKLTCGRNHPLIRYLFEQWVRFGAPSDILYEAHPHIGTDFLMCVAINMRRYLQQAGCEFIFKKRLIDWQCDEPVSGKNARHLCQFDDGTTLETETLVLAIGHSARDTYQMLLDRGLAIGQKPFAIGVRLEHPQEEINQIQYGSCERLPAAEYKLTAQNGDRGIWTFCMCPGGHLLPTGASEGLLAINGMSYHARNSGFANAAVVVNVRREDFDRGHPLDGVTFQRLIEQEAFKRGGGSYHAPAQRLQDFIKGRISKGVMESTYRPGLNAARLDEILPDFVANSLRSALAAYEQRMPGFLSQKALVIGTETKTSAPIIMQRNDDLQSVSHPGLFPAGEGAGFAGGIVSAGLDGVRIARALLEHAQRQSLHLR